MAEMTAEQARRLLQNPFDKRPRLLEIWSDKTNQIAALIQQQAATIEAQGRDIERLTNVYNVANRYIADGLFNVDFNYRQLEKALEIAKQQVREGLNDV